MIRTEAVRYTDFPNGERIIERLYIPESSEKDLEAYWAEEFHAWPAYHGVQVNESTGPNFSNFMPLQGFPAR